MFYSTSSHLQWFFLEDAKKKEMTTCISTLSNNKKFLGSLFFPLKKKEKEKLITSNHTFE